MAHRAADIATAALGVCIGSLLWDAFLGDGIQQEDVFQALSVGLVAAVIQWWLTRKRP